MKNGAPMTAVRIDMGISEAVALRASVSTSAMNTAPRLSEAGTSRVLSLPNIIRAMCGMSSPTHAT